MQADQQHSIGFRGPAQGRYHARGHTRTLERRRCYSACKRVLDILVAGSLLVMLAPLMLVIAVLVRLDSAGPSIFRQERVGTRRQRNGRHETWEIETFTCYKFRSMRHNADCELHRAFVKALIHDDRERIVALHRECKETVSRRHGPLAGTFLRRRRKRSRPGPSEQRQPHKLAHDPRVTRIGGILRKSSLDELPQLWNVLIGDMTLVGPRPPIPYEVEEYEPWHRQRLETKPGLTGLWQIGPRSDADFDEMVRLDIQYIEQQSFWLDLKILMQTPLAAFRGKGAM